MGKVALSITGWQISLLLYLHEGSNSQTNNRAVNLPLFTWSGWPVPTSSGVFGDASSYWIPRPARVICVLHAKPAMDCTKILTTWITLCPHDFKGIYSNNKKIFRGLMFLTVSDSRHSWTMMFLLREWEINPQKKLAWTAMDFSL